MATPPRLPALRLGSSLLAIALALLAACNGDDSGPDPALVQARDRAAEFGLWEKDGWVDARRTLEPIVARKDAAGEDLLRMACAILGSGLPEEALPYVERAAKLVPDHPALHWCRFRIARIAYENQKALEELHAVRRLAPADVPSQLALGMVLSDLAMDEPDAGYTQEAVKALEAFLALPRETTGAWRVTALFRLSSLLTRMGEEERAQPYFEEYKRFGDQGVESPGEPEHQPGSLGSIPPSSPQLFTIETPAAPAAVALREVPGTAGTRGMDVLRFGADPQRTALPGGPAGEELWSWSPPPPELVTCGPTGLAARARSGDAWGAARALAEGDVLDVIPFDRGNPSTDPTSFQWRRAGDPDLDLIVALAAGSGFEVRLLEQKDGAWTLHEPLLAAAGTLAPGHMLAIDLDHEGDLDLVVAGSQGIHVLRNDELDVSPTGVADVSAELPLPAGDFFPLAEDVDRDGDVDLVLVDRGGGALRWLSSERGWRFVDASVSLPRVAGTRACVADFDGTGFVDFAELTDKLRVDLRGPTGETLPTLEWPLPAPADGRPVVCDWDLDGCNDLLWPTPGGGVAGVLAPGLPQGGVGFTLASGRGAAGPCTLQVGDLDGDLDQDVLVLDAQGVREGLGAGPRGLALELRGYKDNTRGVGATVRLRQGLRYRRIFWRGRPELVGAGDPKKLDMLRIDWPNGVEQSYFDVEEGRSLVAWQRPGLVGSCPFLYVWDGKTYAFVSDVLGITPLGLPMAPGMLVPPDHDEYVLVSGDVLVPKDGIYELQLTEELREVTYLDRIRLDAIDHPADVEVFPNERFSFPPFPEHHVHTVRDALAPLEARDGQDRDWSRELAANDRHFAVPFEPLGGQFQGLAMPHTLELSFDPQRVRDAERLRLVMNGWFFWTDASVNMAAARNSEVEFVPPLLQVPDPGGADGWRTVGPPLGFPAGKLKTMVVDVTDLLSRDEPRLRIFSTLRLYWDSIRLATDADDAPFVSSALEPSSARLWERGFSEPIPLEGPHRLEWFEWDRLAAEPRWNQHPGRYTRFGETLPLVTAIDDRFVIMGAGDALTVRFEAAGLPPLPDGWKRDFLVFLDGWAKDRDPNTIEALHVDPLPFHGMSAYPYAAPERFPDDEEHRAWQREWNTRPAKRWLPSLVPPRAGP